MNQKKKKEFLQEDWLTSDHFYVLHISAVLTNYL